MPARNIKGYIAVFLYLAVGPRSVSVSPCPPGRKEFRRKGKRPCQRMRPERPL